MTILDRIKADKIIAIARGIDEDKIIPMCKALVAGGVSMIEVTFNQSSTTGFKETINSIKMISEQLSEEVCVGAGTVMTVEQVELAVEAGAKYIISPNFDKEVIKRTNELGACSLPGVMTPSEITDAYNCGAAAAKIFPVGSFGPSYIKGIKGPISHIPLLAVGGVDANNAADFLNAGAIGLGIGSCLVNKKLIDAGKFSELTQLAKEFVAAVQV